MVGYSPDSLGNAATHNMDPLTLEDACRETITNFLDAAPMAEQYPPPLDKSVMVEDMRMDSEASAVVGYAWDSREARQQVLWRHHREAVVSPSPEEFAPWKARLQELKAQGAPGSSSAEYRTADWELAVSCINSGRIYTATLSPPGKRFLPFAFLRIAHGENLYFSSLDDSPVSSTEELLTLIESLQPATEGAAEPPVQA